MLTLLLAVISGVSFAAEGTSVYFKINKSDLDPSFGDNSAALASLQKTLSEGEGKISKIFVRSSASPDGPLSFNASLSRARARVIIGKIESVLGQVPDSLLDVTVIDEDWDGLKEVISGSSEPWKGEVLSILSGSDFDSAEAALRSLNGGAVWKELARNYLPSLRRTDVTVQFIGESVPPASSSDSSSGSLTDIPPGSSSSSESSSGTSSGTSPGGSQPGGPPDNLSGSGLSGPEGQQTKDNSVPMWTIFVMGGLSALLAVFAGLYFSQRKKLKGLSSPPPASPVSQTQAPDPATVSEPAPAPEPDPVIPAAAVAATGAAAAGAASSAPAAPAAPAPSAFLSNVKSIIQSHVSDPSFGVEELAAAMGISRIHLNRKLQADSNTSPSALLKEARMTLAAESLLKGEESIADIAARSGFSTPSYFSTAFKDYFGMTPSEYISKNS